MIERYKLNIVIPWVFYSSTIMQIVSPIIVFGLFIYFSFFNLPIIIISFTIVQILIIFSFKYIGLKKVLIEIDSDRKILTACYYNLLRNSITKTISLNFSDISFVKGKWDKTPFQTLFIKSKNSETIRLKQFWLFPNKDFKKLWNTLSDEFVVEKNFFEKNANTLFVVFLVLMLLSILMLNLVYAREIKIIFILLLMFSIVGFISLYDNRDKI